LNYIKLCKYFLDINNHSLSQNYQQNTWVFDNLSIISVNDGLSLGSSIQQLFISYTSGGGQSGGIDDALGLFFSMVTCLMIAMGVESSLYGVFRAQIYQSTIA
jgi:hypothetical protein